MIEDFKNKWCYQTKKGNWVTKYDEMIFENIEDINVEEFRLKEWEGSEQADNGDDQHNDSDIESDQASDYGDDPDDSEEYGVIPDREARGKDTHGNNNDMIDHDIDLDSDSDNESNLGSTKQRKRFEYGSKRKNTNFKPEFIKKVMDIMNTVLLVFEMDYFDPKDIDNLFNGQKLYIDINYLKFVVSKDYFLPMFTLKSWDEIFIEYNNVLDDPEYVSKSLKEVKMTKSYKKINIMTFLFFKH